MIVGLKQSTRAAVTATGLAAAVLLTACSGAGNSRSASAGGFPAAVRPAGISQHASTEAAAVRTIALSDDAVLMWRPRVPETGTSSAPPIMNAFVSLSAAVSGIPCFNCVGNPPNPNAFGIAFAQPYLALGSSAEELYTFEDTSLTASCTLKFQFKQNNATLATYAFHNVSVGPGEFVYFHAGSLPSNAVAGPATTTANIVCPGVTTKPAVENIYFH